MTHLRALMAVCCLAALVWAVPAWAEQTAAQATAREASAAPAKDDQARRDRQLQARLEEILAKVERFSGIQAQVSQGVVRLYGKVVSSQDAEEAAGLAAKLDGVIYVDNRVEEETGVAPRLEPAVDRVGNYLSRLLARGPELALALGLIVLAWVVAGLVSRLMALRRFSLNPMLANLIRQLVRAAIILVGVLLALDVMNAGAVVGALLGTAGLFGLAVGFAFKDIVENYLAGAMLSLRRPFGIGELVEVGSESGRVVRLTTRETVLMTAEGNHVLIPNAQVFKSVIRNYSRNPRRAFTIAVGVGTDEDLVRVQELGLGILRAMKGVLDDPPPSMRVERLGDFNVEVVFWGWVDQRETGYFKARSEAIRLIKTALDEAGVFMPEPSQTVHLEQVAAPAPSPADEPSSQTGPDAELQGEAARADVAPDHDLEEQIQDDLETSNEHNLLSDAPPTDKAKPA